MNRFHHRAYLPEVLVLQTQDLSLDTALAILRRVIPMVLEVNRFHTACAAVSVEINGRVASVASKSTDSNSCDSSCSCRFHHAQPLHRCIDEGL